MALGLARGGAPGARIAVYKVCWSLGCDSVDIIAAFDDAIADGVDILSISSGSPFQFPYWEDATSIGSFHAMKHGILTSASAGNSGPERATVQNNAPWLLTVAASSIDRKFASELLLGNGRTFTVREFFHQKTHRFPLFNRFHVFSLHVIPFLIYLDQHTL